MSGYAPFRSDSLSPIPTPIPRGNFISGHSNDRGMEDLKRQISRLEEENKNLTRERDQAQEDLHNVETAFSDLHKKYERAKTTMENLKKNEDNLKARDAAMQKKIAEKDAQLQKLKQEIQETLEKMFSDYEAKAKNTETENTKLKALVRKSEMKISTLESDLEQKAKENKELHVLCDDLINGGGEGRRIR